MATTDQITFEDLKGAPVVFLSRQYKPNPSLEGKHYPSSQLIPAIDEIYDEWLDEKTGKIKSGRRLIRYIPGERSIYAEDQSEGADKKRKGIIRLGEEGYLLVSRTETTLLEYLRKCDYNGSKNHRDGSKAALFFESIPGQKTEEEVDDDWAITELKYRIHTMPIEELEGYAMVLGIPYKNVQSQDLRRNMLIYAQKDIDLFNNIEDMPKMRKKYYVTKAIDEGHVVIDEKDRKASWRSGKMIVQSPISSTPLVTLVDFVHSSEGEDVYNEILRLVNPQDFIESNEPKQEVKPIEEVVKTPMEQLLEHAEQTGAVEKNGPWYCLGGSQPDDEYYNFAMGKKKALEAMSKDDVLRSHIENMVSQTA